MSTQSRVDGQNGIAGNYSDAGEESSVKRRAAAVAEGARHKAEDLVDEGRDKARELRGRAGEMARTRADDEMHRVTDGIRTVAEVLRRGGSELPEDRRQYLPLLDSVASRAEHVSDYLDSRDVDALTSDVRRFAREHTPLFLGGAFALGVLGARFLKSSGERARPTGVGGYASDSHGSGYTDGAAGYDRLLPQSGATGYSAAGTTGVFTGTSDTGTSAGRMESGGADRTPGPGAGHA